MDLIGKKVLVTGAAGFVGSHLVEELVRLGVIVRAFVKYNSKGGLGNLKKLPKDIFDKLEIIGGDLRDIEGVKKAVESCDVIFHLGALISIPYSYENPRGFIETNVMGTLNILEAAKEFSVKKIVITSTSEVYGTALYEPIDEKHPLQAQSPYAASKIAADKIAESFYRSFNMPIAIIRPFNVYGPRQSTRAIIPTIIYQALTKDKIKLGSLTPKRDFTYVKDTVRGYIKIAESENSIGETINIGFGETVSMGDIVETIKSILEKDFEIETDESRIRPEKSEVRLLICDNKKAKELLGWKPKVSLIEGLKQVINYIKDNLHDYKSEENLK